MGYEKDGRYVEHEWKKAIREEYERNHDYSKDGGWKWQSPEYWEDKEKVRLEREAKEEEKRLKREYWQKKEEEWDRRKKEAESTAEQENPLIGEVTTKKEKVVLDDYINIEL